MDQESIKRIVQDIQDKKPVEMISARFHTTLVKVFADTANRIRKKTGIDRIVLSGGVFNNNRILVQTIDCLESNEFSVYTHSRVPCGDGGIALGQAMAAAAILERN